MPGNVHTILFDNDGILVDTEHLYYEATRSVLSDIGIRLSEEEYVQYLLVESRGAFHLARSQGATEPDIAAMRARRNARYDELLRTESIGIPGVQDVLDRFRGRFKMGIVTASEPDHFQTIHRRTGFLPYFEFAVTTEHYTRSKPHPEPYEVAVKLSGHPASECIAIEDSERGLRSALGAGVKCHVVPRGLSRTTRFDGAESIAESLMDVCDAILAG